MTKWGCRGGSDGFEDRKFLNRRVMFAFHGFARRVMFSFPLGASPSLFFDRQWNPRHGRPVLAVGATRHPPLLSTLGRWRWPPAEKGDPQADRVLQVGWGRQFQNDPQWIPGLKNKHSSMELGGLVPPWPRKASFGKRLVFCRVCRKTCSSWQKTITLLEKGLY